ncbi:MAG: hypothetical protein KJZ81_10620 [Burkholderiaceae bacterium]|nr:hypothetical protein [Burkholderiaceae bacterium]
MPFPPLCLDAQDRWQWPAPPFPWKHEPAPANGVAQPARVESFSGAAVEGELLDFDPVAGHLDFRTAADRPTVRLRFSGLRRLTLTRPLTGLPPVPGARPGRVPVAAHEREFTLHAATPGRAALSGRTVGRVEAEAGLYLFEAVDEEAGLQRSFVPRSAYARADFGPTARETAAQLWISDRAALEQALARQRQMPVKPLGQALLALGLLTPSQLERALAAAGDEKPLGQSLVSMGLISATELQAALAYKMGYPMVDLMRFVVDPAAAARLPWQVAERYRILPLMMEGERLVVAIDSPSREADLRAMAFYAPGGLAPVLAPGYQIALALRSNDLWTGAVRDHPASVRTTG